MKIYVCSILLCGCASWETIGVVSVDKFNGHIEKLNDFKKDALDGVEKIGKSARLNAMENMIEAEADDDKAKMKRAMESLDLAEDGVEEIQELEGLDFDSLPETPFDWQGIANTIMGIIMALMTGGVGMAAKYGPQLAFAKAAAIKNAHSTQVDEIDPRLTK